MKVTRNTPQQLILSETPWFIGIMLILFILAFVGPGLLMVADGVWPGIFFALAGGGMGLAALAVFVRRVQVILDRPSDSLTIRRQSLLAYDTVTHRLSELSGAVLEQTRSDKGRTLSRPTLIFDQGMSAGAHPIVEAYTSGKGPKRLVDAVNGWLAPDPADPETGRIQRS